MLDLIQVEDLESSAFCLALLVQKKSRRPQKKQLQRSVQKENKAKRHSTIYGSKNHNQHRYNQEPDAESYPKSIKENHSNGSLFFPETEST